MIRTVIEVEGKDDYEFKRQLEAALDRIGYQPKPSEDSIRWQRDVWAALAEAGIDAIALTKAFQAKQNAIT